jgi:hypothetical protein
LFVIYLFNFIIVEMSISIISKNNRSACIVEQKSTLTHSQNVINYIIHQNKNVQIMLEDLDKYVLPKLAYIIKNSDIKILDIYFRRNQMHLANLLLTILVSLKFDKLIVHNILEWADKYYDQDSLDLIIPSNLNIKSIEYKYFLLTPESYKSIVNNHFIIDISLSVNESTIDIIMSRKFYTYRVNIAILLTKRDGYVIPYVEHDAINRLSQTLEKYTNETELKKLVLPDVINFNLISIKTNGTVLLFEKITHVNSCMREMLEKRKVYVVEQLNTDMNKILHDKNVDEIIVSYI